MRRAKGIAASGLAVVLAVSGACSTGSNRSDGAASPRNTTTTVDPQCRAAASSTSISSTTSVPAACQEQQFRVALADPENAAARAIGAVRALRLARSLCAYAATLPGQDHPPTFDALMSSNATTWKVSKQTATAISRAAVVLCPDGVGAVYSLTGGTKPLKVTYRVDGSGDATVVYTSGDDSFTQEAITAPWRRTVGATSRGVISILATPAATNGRPLTCTIVVGGHQLDQQSSTDPDNGGIAACSVPIAVARRAGD
jgi:hypothetical protein